MNKVIMMGRLTANPTVRYSQANPSTCVATYNLAVNRKFKRKGDPDADFFRVTSFGRNGEFAEKYLHKGMKILVEGELRSDSYTNNDGQKVYTIGIVASSQEFCESKQDSGNATVTDNDGFMNLPEIEEDELPFT